MTQVTKTKLLEVLGDFAMDELSEIALLEVLAMKLKSQETRIRDLHHENDGERIRLRNETERLHHEYKELRRNPAGIMSGPNFFIGDKGEKFMVEINRGQVQCFEVKKKNLRCQLRQITLTEYEEMK